MAFETKQERQAVKKSLQDFSTCIKKLEEGFSNLEYRVTKLEEGKTSSMHLETGNTGIKESSFFCFCFIIIVIVIIIPGNLTPHKFHCTLMRPVTEGSISSAVTRKVNSCGGRVGLVVRALAFHQCGPGSISALGVICGLSLWVLYSAIRGFSLRTRVFPSHQKPTFDLIRFDL